jgi:hypothetical protein
MRGTPSERFWPKVEKRGAEECWPWTGGLSHGYGLFNAGGKTKRAHAFALEEKLGRPLKPKHGGLHSCDNRSCCNPAHLFEGTNGDNNRDRDRKGRTAVIISDETVREARRLRAHGLPFSKIGRKLKIGTTTAFRFSHRVAKGGRRRVVG